MRLLLQFILKSGLFLLLCSNVVLAAGGACGHVECDEVVLDYKDKASLQRGAQLYVNYCFGCHSLRYMRYGRLAEDLDIPPDIATESLIFDGSRIGDLMENALDQETSKRWFGIHPPDLTLIARRYSADRLYTFLRSFYADEERPWGVNNRVVPNVAMPHVLYDLQGLQKCSLGPLLAPNGGIRRDPRSGEDILGVPCGRFELLEPGTMTPEEFDIAMTDLVNFLVYTAEPFREQRYRVGIYALLFLGVFAVFAWLLDRAYWKGLKRRVSENRPV